MKKQIKTALALLSIVILTSCTNTPPPQIPTNIDNDGNSFTTVVIGTQEWTERNLDVSKYRNGDLIPEVTDPVAWAALTTGAWCYYDNDPANGLIYGRLYNWYAVNDPRGLASVGWHVSSGSEWTILTTFLGGDAIAGGKMKTTTGWTTWPNTAADNSSGFSGLPGGGRNLIGEFHAIDNNGAWWNSNEDSPTHVTYHVLNHHDGAVPTTSDKKPNGLSVRCVKD